MESDGMRLASESSPAGLRSSAFSVPTPRPPRLRCGSVSEAIASMDVTTRARLHG